VDVKCYNTLSQLVLSQNYPVVTGANNLAVRLREKGVYILTLGSAQGIATRKVIIE
jgi:rRNA-processing protein FCF1